MIKRTQALHTIGLIIILLVFSFGFSASVYAAENPDTPSVQDSGTDEEDGHAGYPETEQTKSPEDGLPKLASPRDPVSPANIKSTNSVSYNGIAPIQFFQWDDRWKYYPYAPSMNILDSGCGPTSMAMVIATSRDTSVTPIDAANWSRSRGYSMDAYPCTQNAFFTNYGAAYGLDVEYIGKDDNRAYAEVLAGNWVICHMGPGFWTTAQHFNIWYGIDAAGYGLIRDPSWYDSLHTRTPITTLLSQSYGYYVVHFVPRVPPISTAQIVARNDVAGTFRVQLSGVSQFGILSTTFEVWSDAKGKDDLQSYTAVRSGDAYYADISVANHLGDTGNYTIMPIVNTMQGTFTVGYLQTDVYKGSATVSSLQLSSNEKTMSVTAQVTDIPVASTQIQSAVWSAKNGQDDLVWYPGTRSGSVYTATADISRHKDSGLYYAHTYMIRGGISTFLSASSFQVSANAVDALVVQKLPDGRYSLTATGVKAPSGVTSVRIPTWSEKNGQDDLVWYNATRIAPDTGSGETWQAILQPGSHKYDTGNYISHVYVKSGNGVENVALGKTWVIASADAAKTEVFAELSGDEKTIAITTTNIRKTANAAAVNVAVWSTANGQDDLVWYPASLSGDYGYVTATIARHKDPGIYNIHAYAQLSNGSSVFLGAKTVVVSANTAEALTVQKLPDGRYSLTVTGVRAKSGVAAVRIPTWSEKNGQDDLVWYNATRIAPDTGSGETWQAILQPGSHKYDTGNYISHVYVKSGNGVENVALGKTWVIASVDAAKTEVFAELSGDEKTIAITTTNIRKKANAAAVNVAVWSTANGQDDLVWYPASLSGDYGYVTATIARHKDPGIYNIHVYAQLSNGSSVFLGAKTVVVSSNTAEALTVQKLPDGRYTLTVTGVRAPTGVTGVRIPTWSEKNGQDDLVWYNATRIAPDTGSGETWQVTLSPGSHKNDIGNYISHVYVKSGNGVENVVLGKTWVIASSGAASAEVSANPSTPEPSILEADNISAPAITETTSGATTVDVTTAGAINPID